MNDGATALMAAAGMGIVAPAQDEKRGTDRRGLAILDGGIVEPEARVLETITAVLRLGSDIDAANPAGDTALHIASAQGYDTVVRTLVERGADMNLRNTRGLTPLGALMSRRPNTVPCEMPIALATSRLSVAKSNGLVVVDASAWPVGLFTQREALLSRNLPAQATVDEVMSRAVLFMSPETPIHRAAARAAETLARRVLVVEKATVSGIVAPLDRAIPVTNRQLAIRRDRNGPDI